jgi:uncharacterized protein (TIGR00299 family) protein
MILAALLDCGVSLPRLKERLSALKLKNYSISRKRIRRHGISATRLNVRVRGKEKHRSLADVLEIIDNSDLDEGIRSAAATIFRRIARAEAHVHGERIDKIHFHEVGATDAIIDVVGALLALNLLGVEEVYSTPLPLGTGFVETSHGRMPLPAPATVELLKDFPVIKTDREGELTTPTGAILVSSLSLGTIPPSPLSIERIGYGAGHRESEVFPNMLRAIIGEFDTEVEGDNVYVLETNIDDMNPQLVPHLQEEITRAGALDVYRVPVQMKKNRPGMLLVALVEAPAFDQVAETMFRESTTIGLRYWEVARMKLRRTVREVKTSLGKVRIKEITLPSGEKRVKPEHDDCQRITLETGLPLIEVVQIIEKELQR